MSTGTNPAEISNELAAATFLKSVDDALLEAWEAYHRADVPIPDWLQSIGDAADDYRRSSLRKARNRATASDEQVSEVTA
jgi:hypothetical protein